MTGVASERATQARTAAEDYIRSEPLKALGIAAGLGAIIGILIARR